LKQEVEREGVLLFSPREELKKGRTFEQQLLIGTNPTFCCTKQGMVFIIEYSIC